MKRIACATLVAILLNVILPMPTWASDREIDLAGLKAESVVVRCQTVRRLGRSANRSLVPALIETMGDSSSKVRHETARALGMLKDRTAVPILTKALGDPDMNVRFYAAHALGEIKDKQATIPLIDAFDDDEWCVRDQIAWALREINDASTIRPIVALLKNENADVEHISWMVTFIQSSDKIDVLVELFQQADRKTRRRVVGILGRFKGPEIRDPMLEALRDEDVPIRMDAVAYLLKLRDKRAIQPLRQLVELEADGGVRKAAAVAVDELLRHADLIAHWGFDDGSTTVATNELKSGNNGRIIGCRVTEGISGLALEFRGKEYIEFGQPKGMQVAHSPFTVTAWVKAETDNGVVIARGGGFCGYSLYIKDGVAKFGVHCAQAGPAFIAKGTQNIVGKWVFLAGVVRKDRVDVYVDGELAGTFKTDGYLSSDCGQGMEVGFDVANSAAEITTHFQGTIDEVKVYSAALSREEIAEQYRVEKAS